MYCQTADVLARAGAFALRWHETSNPSYQDIELFIRHRAAEIDGALAGRGIAIPVNGVSAEALRSLNAAGALVSLLSATALGAAADKVETLYERMQTEWDNGMLAILKGEHPAVVAEESSGDADSATADDFWTRERAYGTEGWVDPVTNPEIGPMFTRTEIF